MSLYNEITSLQADVFNLKKNVQIINEDITNDGKEVKVIENYNFAPLIMCNESLKSLNVDDIGNLKLYDVDKKMKGRSKFAGNIYFSSLNSKTLYVYDSNGAILKTRTFDSAVTNFEKHYNSNGKIRYTFGLFDTSAQVYNGGGAAEYYKFNIYDENFSPIKQDIKIMANGSVKEFSCDMHEFLYINDNHYIIDTYYPIVRTDIPGYEGKKIKVLATVIQEIKDDKVIFQWESYNYKELYNLSFNTDDYENSTYDKDQETDGTEFQYSDYLHINAIAVHSDGNLVLSFRHLGIVKINRTTGDIMWIIGKKRNDFSSNGYENVISNAQHYIRAQKDGSLTCFDNNGCSTNNLRICRWWLNEDKKEIKKFKQYVLPHVTRMNIMGSAQLLDEESETFLLGYGANIKYETNGVVGFVSPAGAFEEYCFSTGKSNIVKTDSVGYRVYTCLEDSKR